MTDKLTFDEKLRVYENFDGEVTVEAKWLRSTINNCSTQLDVSERFLAEAKRLHRQSIRHAIISIVISTVVFGFVIWGVLT